MRYLIGINGFAGSGKSAAANYLGREHGFETMKFAAYLKSATYGMLVKSGFEPGCAMAMIEGDRKEKYSSALGTTPREFMQWLGNGARDQFGDDFWTNKFINDFLMKELDACIVCDDVRYQNEADIIRNLGGYVVRIDRPGVGPVNGHVSENSLPDEFVDGIIRNDGAYQDLYDEIDHHMHRYLEDAA